MLVNITALFCIHNFTRKKNRLDTIEEEKKEKINIKKTYFNKLE